MAVPVSFFGMKHCRIICGTAAPGGFSDGFWWHPAGGFYGFFPARTPDRCASCPHGGDKRPDAPFRQCGRTVPDICRTMGRCVAFIPSV